MLQLYINAKYLNVQWFLVLAASEVGIIFITFLTFSLRQSNTTLKLQSQKTIMYILSNPPGQSDVYI